MVVSQLLNTLREFYTECSNRGWCTVERKEGKDFFTLYSSETNFTHLPLNFGRFPEKCLVSPRLASANIKKLELIASSADSTRLTNVVPCNNGFKVYITDSIGNIIYKTKLKLYTIKGSKAVYRLLNKER